MANVCPYGYFTHAVVRGVPETFGKPAADGRENGEASVDLAKAQRQFGCLTGALRQKVGLQLIEIPPDPELPESWRIEDVAVIQGDMALITRPFKQQRRSEVEAVRRVMSELNLTVVEMGGEEGDSGGATLEGSDVLFTGREFFVGISSHTNRRGAEVLADTFRDFAVSTVPVCGGARLKNICSMGGPDTIIISNSDGAKKTLRMMEQLTDHHYEVLSVPEESAANCIYIKGPSKRDFLLHRPAEECPDSASSSSAARRDDRSVFPLLRPSRSCQTTPCCRRPAARPPSWERRCPPSASSSIGSIRISESGGEASNTSQYS